MIIFLFIQIVHGMGILWLVLQVVVFSLISMRLPDSASIFTAEIWVIIKALEEIKHSVASKYIVFYRLNFMSPSFTIYEAGTSLNWDGDTKICLLKF